MSLYNTFDVCVDGNDETDETIRDWARGFVFGESEITLDQSIGYGRHLDTVDGIDIYYDFGGDYYFFCPVDLDEWS